MNNTFKYNVGDFVRSKMNDAVYQIVGQVNVYDLINIENRYYFRKIFDSKIDYKPGKAQLVHESWLYDITDKTMSKIKVKLLLDEISSFVKDITLDPLFSYEFYLGVNNSAYFVIDRKISKEINNMLDRISEDRLDFHEMKIIINSYINDNKLKSIKYQDKEKITLNENESFYRLEIGRYENDYEIEYDFDTFFYRKARLVKVR